ncbi:MAG: STAS/SEC14 domain-containing protein [Tunicatimonas sp.]
MLTAKKIADHVIRLVIDGEVKQSDIDQAANVMKDSLKEPGKLRLLMEVKNMEGYDSIEAFLKDTKKTFQHYTDFEKMAIVTEEKWLASIASLGDLINPANIKQFSLSERELAEEWVEA